MDCGQPLKFIFSVLNPLSGGVGRFAVKTRFTIVREASASTPVRACGIGRPPF